MFTANKTIVIYYMQKQSSKIYKKKRKGFTNILIFLTA